jgi:hypothetical protein
MLPVHDINGRLMEVIKNDGLATTFPFISSFQFLDGECGIYSIHQPLIVPIWICAYFFPIVFSIPLFGNHLAQEWL